jgi:hypothetical protein
MRGRIAWERLPAGGTEASVEVTVRPVPGQETPAGGVERPAAVG